MKIQKIKTTIQKLLLVTLGGGFLGITFSVLAPHANAYEVTTTTTRTVTTSHPAPSLSIVAQIPFFGFGFTNTHYTTVAQHNYYQEENYDDGSWKNKEYFAKKPMDDSYNDEGSSGKCGAWDGKGQCLKKVW